jgi:hypothetical protein
VSPCWYKLFYVIMEVVGTSTYNLLLLTISLIHTTVAMRRNPSSALQKGFVYLPFQLHGQAMNPESSCRVIDLNFQVPGQF